MKLLIATEFPPDAPGGGPAVVRQMLQGFPGDLHWWSVRGGNAETLKTEKLKEIGVIRHFCGCPPGKLMPARKLPKLKAWLMENLWAPRAVRDLESAIRAVQPDCIWVIPHDWSIIPLWRVMTNERWKMTNDKSKMTDGRETRVHVTIQDYPDVHGHGRAWGENRVQRMARMQEKIYASADSRDATSLPMLEDLEKRTDKPGLQMLHQGLEPEDFAFLEKQLFVPRSSCLVGEECLVPGSSFVFGNAEPGTRNQEPRTIKIAYAGTILCEPEFALFVSLLEKIRLHPSTLDSRLSTPSLELHLFGAHSYASRPWFRPWIIEHGNLPERELLTELRKCDWGFIPMSLEDTDPRYNRFSFPTKFITYLAAGLPIITMGHPESSVMKMATAYNVGVTIQSSTPTLDQIATALFAPDARTAYLLEILRCAREQFDAEKMRLKLWEAFGLVPGS